MTLTPPLTLGIVADSSREFDAVAARFAPHVCHPIAPDDLDDLEDWGGRLGALPLGAFDAVLVAARRGQVPALSALARPSRRAGTPVLAVGDAVGDADGAAMLLLTGADSVLPEGTGPALVYASVRAYKRVRSAARQVEAATTLPAPADRQLRVGPITADFRTFRVTVDGVAVDLPPRQFDLLVYLMDRPGEVVTRDAILNDVWGLGFDPSTNIVNVYVHYLRQKLAPYDLIDAIVTVRGRGFRFDPAALESRG